MSHHLSPLPLDAARNERGVALIVALMSLVLLTTLGLALVATTMTETLITNNYRDSGEAMYAADAGVERVMQDLLAAADWNHILAGGMQSSFVDGPPGGTRQLPDGRTLDLTAATNLLNCERLTACSPADIESWSIARPYRKNNPHWRLFAYAPLANIIETGTVLSPMYVVVWIGDDYGETDDNPLIDGGPGLKDTDGDGELDNPGEGVLMLRAEAWGPNNAHSIIEVLIGRTDTTELERGYTGQRGQDEQNRRARKAPVQVPGKALLRSGMDATAGTFQSR